MESLNKTELRKIRKSLPEDGYQQISEMLNNMPISSIRMILTIPSRYKKDVIDAAIKVIEKYKELLNEQKVKIKDL